MRVWSTVLTIALAAGALALPDRADATLFEAADAASFDATTMTPADTVEAVFDRAGELYAKQRYSEAIPLFNRVVELDARHGNAYALLGGSYLHLGDYPRAINAFERALQLDEGIKLAYLGLVSANYLSERVEDARQWVNRMVPILTGDERKRYLTTIADQFPRLELNAGGS